VNTQENVVVPIRPAQMLAGGSVMAIVPQSFEDVQRLAKVAVVSSIFKPTLSKKDEEQLSPEECKAVAMAQASMAIMHGMECGIPPMQALQNISVINGKCTIWGSLVPALILAAGHSLTETYEGMPGTDDFKAVCRITRCDRPAELAVTEGEFSIKDAKDARLWSPDDKVTRYRKDRTSYQIENDSPWHCYWKRMLQMRARGRASDGVADVLRGLSIREEAEDFVRQQTRDITPASDVAQSAPVSNGARRRLAPPPPPPPAAPIARDPEPIAEWDATSYIAKAVSHMGVADSSDAADTLLEDAQGHREDGALTAAQYQEVEDAHQARIGDLKRGR
jgi:hypothetical protein